MTEGWLDDDPGEEIKKDERTMFDCLPMRRALEYVVEEARKHKAAGHNDHFVAVGRACQAVLIWERLDRAGNFEDAEQWLNRIPR